jgi:hypothetical protein
MKKTTAFRIETPWQASMGMSPMGPTGRPLSDPYSSTHRFGTHHAGTPFRHQPCRHAVSINPPHPFPLSLRTLQISYRPTLRAPRTAYRMHGPPHGARRAPRRRPQPHLRALRHPYPTAHRWLPRTTQAERPPFRKVALPLDVTKSAQSGRARGSRRGL